MIMCTPHTLARLSIIVTRAWSLNINSKNTAKRSKQNTKLCAAFSVVMAYIILFILYIPYARCFCRWLSIYSLFQSCACACFLFLFNLWCIASFRFFFFLFLYFNSYSRSDSHFCPPVKMVSFSPLLTIFHLWLDSINAPNHLFDRNILGCFFFFFLDPNHLSNKSQNCDSQFKRAHSMNVFNGIPCVVDRRVKTLIWSHR